MDDDKYGAVGFPPSGGAYKWALDNIGEICSSKSIAMEASQPPPLGARCSILSEKTTDDGMLEITFKVLQ